MILKYFLIQINGGGNHVFQINFQLLQRRDIFTGHL
jgi:hypothetical protein